MISLVKNTSIFSCELLVVTIVFFTNSTQYKNGNIANFVLAVPLEIDYNNRVYNLKILSSYNPWPLISHLLTS